MNVYVTGVTRFGRTFLVPVPIHLSLLFLPACYVALYHFASETFSFMGANLSKALGVFLASSQFPCLMPLCRTRQNLWKQGDAAVNVGA